MIWYLLYPFRGTTEAPVLSPGHPLRYSFSRYGKWAAQHVKTTLSISVAVAFMLLYPLPYLYSTDVTNFTNGASNLPHHVWTDAQPLDGKVSIEPDVIMRSIWVHGSYMKALEPDVLLGALALQDEILGPTENFSPRRPPGAQVPEDLGENMSPQDRDAFHIINGLTSRSWFFHSPLQYWSGSMDNIAADKDILGTVNDRKTLSTSVNVTLRHSIVFSGKRFEDRRLVAADALVITLIHRRDSPVGRRWMRKAADLAERGRDRWTIIPEDGQSMSSQLYEFQFRPVSTMDWILLTIAYLLCLVFLVWSLSKLRAVKSKLGLIAAVLLQIAAAVGSSFTVCAILQVDLSKIPSYAYPLVVLAISMENSFRLINTVTLTSASLSVSSRIGTAFGETAHMAVANRAQNLLILWGLSKATYPGVEAFCKFGAIAIMFDFFFLATFFLSVLSVDVRQRELSDMEKASVKKTRKTPSAQHRRPWADIWRQVEMGSLSTRLAGSFVCAGFVLIAGEHFATGTWLQRLGRIFIARSSDQASNSGSSLLIDIHQARSPTSWLRLQDHETAREVINVVKPWAHSYVARVYDPLVFVLKGSDRTPHTKEPLFLPAVYDFVHHETFRYLLLVALVVGVVRFVASQLVEERASAEDPDHPDDEPLLSVKSLSLGHSLDVALLAASGEGHLVSVGLGRIIQIWNVRFEGRSPVHFDPNINDPFPVLGLAIDDESIWLAFLSSDRVQLWSIPDQTWGPTLPLELGGQKLEACFFGPKESAIIPSLIVVKRNGKMLELFPDSGDAKEYLICKTPLIAALPLGAKSSSPQQRSSVSILTASRRSCVHHVTRDETGWISKDVKLADRAESSIHSLIPLLGGDTYLVAHSRTVDLVRLDTSEILHTFQTEPMRPRSLRQTQSYNGSAQTLRSFTIAYVSAETDELVLQTYLPEEGYEAICCCDPKGPGSDTCTPWSRTTETRRRVKNPGAWEALGNGSVLGLRRKQAPPRKDPILANPTGLRWRGASRSDGARASPAQRDACPWEVWVMSQLDSCGDQDDEAHYETRPLWTPEDDVAEGDHLMISELGPMIKLGNGSVAVGFGNVVKVLSAGHEHFDNGTNRLTTDNLMNLTNRRRKGTALSRNRMALFVKV